MTTTRDRISTATVAGKIGTYDILVDGRPAARVTGAANLAATLRTVRDRLIEAA